MDQNRIVGWINKSICCKKDLKIIYKKNMMSG
jgi:hypothetical protein